MRPPRPPPSLQSRFRSSTTRSPASLVIPSPAGPLPALHRMIDPAQHLAASCIHVSEPISSPLRWPRSARGLRVAPARSPLSSHHRASCIVHHQCIITISDPSCVFSQLLVSYFITTIHLRPAALLSPAHPAHPARLRHPARTLPYALPLSRTPRVAPTTHDPRRDAPTADQTLLDDPRRRASASRRPKLSVPCHSSTSHQSPAARHHPHSSPPARHHHTS